jgi:four helix bundle protein
MGQRDRSEELAQRLARYAGRVLAIAAGLAAGAGSKHVQDQLVRSGTAPGAHYAEARSAQSGKDFIHKTALAAKEARESVHWLRTAVEGGLTGEEGVELAAEGMEIAAILNASVTTARKRASSR